MAAQQCNAIINAIYIDEDAYLQATVNFNNSPWGDRIQCIDRGLAEFTASGAVSTESIAIRYNIREYTTLTIRDSHGKYTQEYINLAERFYLKLS